MRVDIKILKEGAEIPKKAHDSDYGYDCYATSCQEVAPNVFKYGLGIALQPKPAPTQKNPVAIMVYPRSSVWKHGMVLSNSVGIVDMGYTGEISAVFYRVSGSLPKYRVGDKICQIALSNGAPMEFNEVEELAQTDRGTDGYGSTDKQKQSKTK